MEEDALTIKSGSYGWSHGCQVVDIVPNLFLARTSSLLKVRWDGRLKLGEHEEFFLRVKKVRLIYVFVHSAISRIVFTHFFLAHIYIS